MGEVYKTIDKLLEERNITGTKLCTDLGMSRSFLTELRKGRTKGLNAETAKKIANYFGVSMEYLLTGVEEKAPAPKPDGRPDETKFDDFTYAFYNEFKELSQKDKDMLLEMARFMKRHMEEG